MENNEETIAKLKKLARKTKDARQRRQYDIVRLNLKGRKPSEIAEIQSIYNVLNRYKAKGIERLEGIKKGS